MCTRARAKSLAFVGMITIGTACGSTATKDSNDGGGGFAGSSVGTGGRAPTGGGLGTAATGSQLGSGGQGMGASGTGGTVSTGGRIGLGGSFRVGGATASGGATQIDGGLGAGGTPGTGGRGAGGAGGVQGTGGKGAGGGGAGGATTSDASGSDAAADLASPDVATDSNPLDAAADSAPDVSTPDSPTDLPMTSDVPPDGPGSASLDDCFQGLPAPVGAQMVATKSTVDGRVRVRIALDTEDRFGTSGTYAWDMIRLGVEVDGVVTCIKDRANLSYGGSHHNCTDTASATSGTTTYSFVAPDRSPARLTITSGGTTAGPYTLTDTACTYWGLPRCASGGPC